MKKTIRWISALAALSLTLSLIGFYCISQIPETYNCYPGDPPVRSAFYTLETDGGTNSEEGGSYTARVKLFGFLPIKNAIINRIAQKQLVALGTPFGVKMYTKGVIVVDAEEDSAGIDAGIQVGDIILSYNGVEVRSNEELRTQVQQSGGKRQRARIMRNQRTQSVWVTPHTDGDSYTIGLWVRDSTAGLGTLTYYDPETGIVAGLGHSISDVDTGLTMPVDRGTLVSAYITGIKAGEKGTPGELLGYLGDRTLAAVSKNNEAGLFGSASADFTGVSYPIALKDEIKLGEAQIISTVNGETPELYTIEITRINNNLSEHRNLCITVTDERLLKLTGGIVQGMSGSPILQNGRIIGAVTHVLVNDPTSGYGIFIEKMLTEQEN